MHEALQLEKRAAAVRPDSVSGVEPPGRVPEVDAFAEIVRDNPDGARALVRKLSQRDKAVLTFYLRELERITEEEESFVRADDRRTARDTYGSRTAPDLSAIVDGHVRDV